MATNGDSFKARSDLRVGERRFGIYRLDALADRFDVTRLPYSLKILLENLLRHEGDGTVTTADVEAVAGWDPAAHPDTEIAFSPARILMQDFTGVPSVVDLAAMRDAMAVLGGDPALVNPQIPAELVIDHSVIADVHGTPDAYARNAALELARNEERYKFLRWGQRAFENLRVVPPDTGICHQVNLEYLARVVFDSDDGLAYPDTLLGTDSHTTMINGLGVLGWGVGGIEAEAAMLGQPVSMLIPPVVGFKLSGSLPEGSTATDMVLTVTEMLRGHGVVGKFVEFYGEGISRLPLANRATIGNMSPEYGSTCAIFPIDDETLRYLRLTGRSEERIALVEAYAKDQGLWHDPSAEPAFSERLELDLSTVVPSLAGPARPQDLVRLDQARAEFRMALRGVLGRRVRSEAVPVRPSAPPPQPSSDPAPDPVPDPVPVLGRASSPTPVALDDGTTFEIDHGHVVIAAITSCTNTSNPEVMMAAGLLARNAVVKGLRAKPWVKTTLAPGSRTVVDYYEKSGLTPYLDELGFNLVGFGCTTCIGNSGPLVPAVSQAIVDGDLAAVSVLSGNRNFEGRINPDVRMNYLASPPLVVAYSLVGSMDVDIVNDPLGTDTEGNDVYLRDIWPSPGEIAETISASINAEQFRTSYQGVFDGDERWQNLEIPVGERFEWDDRSTYIRHPPYFDGMAATPGELSDIRGARVLAFLGDSVTTDHISPAGDIRPDGPAGRWLVDGGVGAREFNSYGARRGNHEVMIRGTFANIRLRNQLAAGTEGGVTRHLPDGEVMAIYDAAQRYRAEGIDLIILAGREYGSGSSRDWAAKGTALLGVRAVIAQSFERIHRSNLVGMGILPLQLAEGVTMATLGLSGEETFDIAGLEGLGGEVALPRQLSVIANHQSSGRASFDVTLRIDTPKEAEYFRHGGILPFVVRQLYNRGA